MSVGFGQILIILIIALIPFGAGRLPTVMADLAKGIRAFKKGLADEGEDDQVKTNSTPELTHHPVEQSLKDTSSVLKS